MSKKKCISVSKEELHDLFENFAQKIISELSSEEHTVWLNSKQVGEKFGIKSRATLKKLREDKSNGIQSLRLGKGFLYSKRSLETYRKKQIVSK